jgi:hypothetical protein
MRRSFYCTQECAVTVCSNKCGKIFKFCLDQEFSIGIGIGELELMETPELMGTAINYNQSAGCQVDIKEPTKKSQKQLPKIYPNLPKKITLVA